MTFENAKRLYDHYVKSNQLARAEELKKKYPALGEQPKEEKKEEEKPKKKSKKQKK